MHAHAGGYLEECTCGYSWLVVWLVGWMKILVTRVRGFCFFMGREFARRLFLAWGTCGRILVHPWMTCSQVRMCKHYLSKNDSIGPRLHPASQPSPIECTTGMGRLGRDGSEQVHYFIVLTPSY